jgi:hypothetical protein
MEQTLLGRVNITPPTKGTIMRKLLITAAIVAVAIPAMAQQPSPPANRDAL